MRPLITLLSGSHFYKDRSKNLRRRRWRQVDPKLGKRILRLLRFYSYRTFSLPCHGHQLLPEFILSTSVSCVSQHDTLASTSSHNSFQQCIFPDSKHQCHCFTASILSNILMIRKYILERAKQAVLNQDNRLNFQAVTQHKLVKLASETKTGSVSGRLPEIMVHIILDPCRITQPFFSKFSHTLCSELECCCPKCSTTIPGETTYCEHLVEHHRPSCNYPWEFKQTIWTKTLNLNSLSSHSTLWK